MSGVRGQSCLFEADPDIPDEFALTPPSQVARFLNDSNPMDTDLAQYFTMVYGILDVPSRDFRYVAAGHAGPLVVPRKGEPIRHDSTAQPIGLFEGTTFEEGRLSARGRGPALPLHRRRDRGGGTGGGGLRLRAHGRGARPGPGEDPREFDPRPARRGEDLDRRGALCRRRLRPRRRGDLARPGGTSLRTARQNAGLITAMGECSCDPCCEVCS